MPIAKNKYGQRNTALPQNTAPKYDYLSQLDKFPFEN